MVTENNVTPEAKEVLAKPKWFIVWEETMDSPKGQLAWTSIRCFDERGDAGEFLKSVQKKPKFIRGSAYVITGYLLKMAPSQQG